MRRKDKEIKDMTEIDEIINNSDICRIALIDKEQKPYIVPLNYGYKDGILYFHSAKSGRKIDILKENNYVCFEIENSFELLPDENPCEWTTKYKSVIGYGNIEIINDMNEKIIGLNTIMSNYTKEEKLEYKESIVKNLLVLKLKIDEVSCKHSL